MQAARIDRPAPAGAPPTYLDATVRLDDVDLAELIKRLGVELPVELTGRLSFQVKLGIPINTARDFKTYRLQGTAALSTLLVSANGQPGLHLSKVAAQIDYTNGVLRLEKLSGELPGPGGKSGAFHGSARVGVLPRGDASFDLTGARPARGPSRTSAARIAGQDVRRPVGDHSRRRAARSRAGPDGLARRGQPARPLAGAFRADVPRRLGERDGLPRHGVAVGRHGRTARRSPSRLAHPVADGRETIPGRPPAPRARCRPIGDSLADSLVRGRRARSRRSVGGGWRCAGAFQHDGFGQVGTGAIHLAGVQIDKLAFSWTLADETLKVSDFTAAIGKGKAAGTAEVSLDVLAGQTGKPAVRMDLSIADVDLHLLTTSFKDLPFRVAGQASGKVAGAYTPPGKEDRMGKWAGEVDFSAATLKLQDVPVQKLRGRVEYRGGKGEYHLDGETLGGKLSIEGKWPSPPMSSVGRYDGQLRLERALLGRLWRPLGLGEQLGRLHGVLTVELPFRHEGPSMTPVGQGRFEVRNLRWQDGELAENIRGDIRLTAEGVFVRDIAADLAGGQLRYALSYHWRDASRNWFNVNLSQAEAGRLLIFDSDAPVVVQGPIDVHLRGTMGVEWRGAGSVEMVRGKVMGVEVTDFRLPVDFTFVPKRGRGELSVHESHAQVGQGRAQLQASIAWGGNMRVEGSLRLFDASLRTLGGMLGDVSQYARGRVTGRVDFGGGEVRSINDVTATAQATLKEAQALQLPILNLVVPFLLPGQGGVTFREGEFKARLAGGVWRIQQMTLESALAHLIVQGNMTVQGRLDLDVVAQTSSLGGVNPLLLRGLLARIPPIGPVPVGLIFQATELLSNRIFRLHISGTTKSPRITFAPIRVLSEEAVRFFLTRTLIPTR